MIENVPRLAKDARFARFVRSLRSLGYNTHWQILNAADFGIPQRRKRLVLLASVDTMPKFATNKVPSRTVRDAIGSMSSTRNSSDPLHNYSSSRSLRIQRMIARIPKNGGSRLDLGRLSQLECHQRTDGFKDIYGRMSWDEPAPTITTGCINPSKGRFLHPTSNRAITLREAALLQGFPKRYRFDLTKGYYAVALLVGNALPPGFIRYQAVALRNCLTKEHESSRERDSLVIARTGQRRPRGARAES
jgi:DNA (cytosine-5)-methyltransferase 1